MRGVYNHLPVLHRGSKAVERSRCRTCQDSACHAELSAVTRAKDDVTFWEIVHGALLVCAFVRQRQHACRLSYQQKTPLPDMRHASDGELLERAKGELPSSLPWRERRKEEFEEEPELPSHGYAKDSDPAQAYQASAGEYAPRVLLRALPS